MRSLPCALALLLIAATPAIAAEPLRIALVRPAHPDKITREAATRLQAELLAAGFAVLLVDPEPPGDADPNEAPAPPMRAAATVVLLPTAQGPAADVSIPDRATHTTLVQRVDTRSVAEPSRPADLAIRAVELLRARLLEASPSSLNLSAPEPAPEPEPAASARPPAASAHPSSTPAHPPAAPEPEPAAPDALPPAPDAQPPARRPREPRALLERFTVELGLTGLYGLGDASARLATTLRLGYGSQTGVAARITGLGLTGTDQAMLVEVAYGGGRWATLFAPVVALGLGFDHTHIDDTSSPMRPRFITDAWSAAASASLGVAARPAERAALVLDAHALLIDPMPGSVVFTMPASGHLQYLLGASIGILGGF